MKKINIFFTVLLTIGLSSCNDFLEVEPSNSGDSKTSIQTPADAQVMINGIMRHMTGTDYYGRNFILYGDAKGGDLTIYSQGRGMDQLYTFNHSVSTNTNSGFWSHLYKGILQVNNLLENIAKVETAGSTAYSSYKGQALTARALMYFDLVRLYGKSYDDDKASFGVPNVTATLAASDQPLRATVEQNYTQILADLKAAALLLPKTTAKSATHGYLSYYSNLAIQARVYLYMKDYPNALKAAEEIILSNVYTLYSNAAWVDSWKTTFGSESIFELGVLPTAEGGDLVAGSIGFYTRAKGHGASTALGFFMASDYFLNRLKQDAADVRWGVMAADESSATHLGGIYKYSGSTTLAGDKTGSNTAVNLKVVRLSEIYLIAAEAAFSTDKTKSATYLQAIRKRSPNLVAATAANVTLDMILDERSKELIGEGHRFFDMIRSNKSITFNDEFNGVAIPATSRPKTIDRTFFKTRLPISQTEINTNPGIKAQQNPGY